MEFNFFIHSDLHSHTIFLIFISDLEYYIFHLKGCKNGCHEIFVFLAAD